MTQPVTELAELLRSMQPSLDAVPYAIIHCDEKVLKKLSQQPFATIQETEGPTVIIEHESLHATDRPESRYARITLTVWSALEAVGLTAAVATALADAEIPANVVAGFYHDHIFVPWQQRGQALEVLHTLSA